MKLAAYALYFLSLCTALLIAFFPSEEIKTCLEKNLSAVDPRFSVSIGGLKPSFPFGIKAEQVALEMTGKPGKRALLADSFCIGILPWRILRGEYAFEFGGGVLGGCIDGDFRCGDGGISGPFQADLHLENIRLKDASSLTPGLDGVMTAKLVYHKGEGSMLDGSGEAEVSLSRCRICFSKPQLDLDSVQLENANAAVSLRGRKAELNQFVITGQGFNGRLEGSLQLEDTLDESRLGLRGTLSFDGGAVKKTNGIASEAASQSEPSRDPVAFLVQGTLGKPDVRLMP